VNPETKPTKPASGWTMIRQHLADWPRPALVALIKDLHDASPENRDFLRARFDAKNAGGDALEKYRRKIVEQFFPKRGFGKLKLAEARKAIRDYRKATGNVVGTIDLLLTFVENGTEFTQQFGDINEAYYNSLESAAAEMSRLLLGEGKAAYDQFSERIRRVESLANHIGWGYGDYIRDWAGTLENELGSK
jgi:5'-deoxynucleotidase YfbR-like HD superfamily hydrolase